MRFGTPAVTTRGFREAEIREVGALIVRVLENVSSEEVLVEVRRKVAALTNRFPLYAWKLATA
jgi:glycine hydroxymethyltransferase